MKRRHAHSRWLHVRAIEDRLLVLVSAVGDRLFGSAAFIQHRDPCVEPAAPGNLRLLHAAGSAPDENRVTRGHGLLGTLHRGKGLFHRSRRGIVTGRGDIPRFRGWGIRSGKRHDRGDKEKPRTGKSHKSLRRSADACYADGSASSNRNINNASSDGTWPEFYQPMPAPCMRMVITSRQNPVALLKNPRCFAMWLVDNGGLD